MESCSNQKSVKQIKIYFRFFKVATYALMTALHSLNQLYLECFSNRLEGVPRYAEHLFADLLSLCSPSHLKPSQLV